MAHLAKGPSKTKEDGPWLVTSPEAKKYTRAAYFCKTFLLFFNSPYLEKSKNGSMFLIKNRHRLFVEKLFAVFPNPPRREAHQNMTKQKKNGGEVTFFLMYVF
jgi:hypothetical protein